MATTLGQIIELLEREHLLLDFSVDENRSIDAIHADSRKIKSPKCAFVAMKGTQSDGHRYIGQVLSRVDALIFLTEKKETKSIKGDWILIHNPRRAWAFVASLLAGSPEKKLNLYGITGTNGKTSSVWLIKSLYEISGKKCLSVGTLGAWLGSTKQETSHTTPDPDFFYPLLAKAYEEGIEDVFMEVSSHAIAQEKLAPLKFKGVGFTSFSRDHLDFHISMEEYLGEKLRLFNELCAEGGFKIMASHVRPHAGELRGVKYYGSSESQADMDFSIKVKGYGDLGSQAEVSGFGKNQSGEVGLLGGYSLENFLNALIFFNKATGTIFNEEFWRKIPGVPGRLERVGSNEGGKTPLVLVDYAHTPDALEQVLKAIHALKRDKLWVVFGCGGDRDPGKRKEMARVAEKLTERVVVTSDNPRTEPITKIIDEIVKGFLSPEDSKINVIQDRSEAIQFAVKEAGGGDTIVIAGKGHEDYQIIGTEKKYFDDRVEALAAIKKRVV